MFSGMTQCNAPINVNPGGKGASNGWGFNREFYPHRRAFVKVFCPGAGDLPFDIIQHAISVRSLEPRIEKTGSPETYYFLFPLLSSGI
jgi:hypothetical protein